ncbi:hypothetical protein HK102_001066 [Quaeritorhiza haematococci]|nr:hypothetical protein HK102_001066 [Quaeritorhiza haematococci]
MSAPPASLPPYALGVAFAEAPGTKKKPRPVSLPLDHSLRSHHQRSASSTDEVTMEATRRFLNNLSHSHRKAASVGAIVDMQLIMQGLEAPDVSGSALGSEEEGLPGEGREDLDSTIGNPPDTSPTTSSPKPSKHHAHHPSTSDTSYDSSVPSTSLPPPIDPSFSRGTGIVALTETEARIIADSFRESLARGVETISRGHGVGSSGSSTGGDSVDSNSTSAGGLFGVPLGLVGNVDGARRDESTLSVGSGSKQPVVGHERGEGDTLGFENDGENDDDSGNGSISSHIRRSLSPARALSPLDVRPPSVGESGAGAGGGTHSISVRDDNAESASDVGVMYSSPQSYTGTFGSKSPNSDVGSDLV